MGKAEAADPAPGKLPPAEARAAPREEAGSADRPRAKKRAAARPARAPAAHYSEAAGLWRARSGDDLELFLGWFGTEKEALLAAKKYASAWRGHAG